MIAGVDGCEDGWMAACQSASGEIELTFVERAEDLLEVSGVRSDNAISNRVVLTTALDELVPFLAAFVRQSGVEVPRSPRRAPDSGDDISIYVKAVIDNWHGEFAQRFPTIVKTYFHELREVRTSWAHRQATVTLTQ